MPVQVFDMHLFAHEKTNTLKETKSESFPFLHTFSSVYPSSYDCIPLILPYSFVQHDWLHRSKPSSSHFISPLYYHHSLTYLHSLIVSITIVIELGNFRYPKVTIYTQLCFIAQFTIYSR